MTYYDDGADETCNMTEPVYFEGMYGMSMAINSWSDVGDDVQ